MTIFRNILAGPIALAQLGCGTPFLTKTSLQILTTVFGIPTHKHKVPPKTKPSHQHADHSRPIPLDASSPDAFLRSIFFRRPVSAEAKRLSTDLTPRTGARPLRNTSLHTRRRSASQTPRPSPLRLSRSIDTDDNMDYYLDNTSMASSRRPLLMISSTTPSSTLRSRRTASRAEPLSLGLSLTGLTSPEDFGTPSTSFGTGRSMPDAKASAGPEDDGARPPLYLAKAVVVSGLEHAGLQAQRSLSQALAQRRLILDEDGTAWNLPDDFLLVYVCKADPQERPPLLRGLVCQRPWLLWTLLIIDLQLDKFSLSADVAITSSARQAYAAYRCTPLSTPHGSPYPSSHSLPPHGDGPMPFPPTRTPTSRSAPLPSIASVSQSPGSAALNPLVCVSDLAMLRALASPTPSADAHAYTAIHPSLTAYIRDLFAATRHHPVLEGTSLTYQAQSGVEALARAFRVLAGDSLGTELVQVAVELDQASLGSGRSGSTNADNETINGNGVGGLEKEVTGMDWTAPQGIPRLSLERADDENTPLNANNPFADGVEQATVTPTLAPVKPPEVWDVSEVDIARVFPRVVSHRLRVRDGPDHEILGSVMYPAVNIIRDDSAGLSGDESAWERRTVKDVLVEILADV